MPTIIYCIDSFILFPFNHLVGQGKMLLVLVQLVLSDVKLWIFLPFAVLTRQSICWQLVLVRVLSGTSRPLLNALLMNSSMLLKVLQIGKRLKILSVCYFKSYLNMYRIGALFQIPFFGHVQPYCLLLSMVFVCAAMPLRRRMRLKGLRRPIVKRLLMLEHLLQERFWLCCFLVSVFV